MPFKSKAQEHYLRMNEPKIYREWMDKYGPFKEAESFEASQSRILQEKQKPSNHIFVHRVILDNRLRHSRKGKTDYEYLLSIYYYDDIDHTDECYYKAVVEGPIGWRYLNGLKSERPYSCNCTNEVCLNCKNAYHYGRSCDCTIYSGLCSNCCPTGKCESYDYGAYRKEREAEKKEKSEREKQQERMERAIQIKEKMNSPMLKGSIAFVVGLLIGGNMRR